MSANLGGTERSVDGEMGPAVSERLMRLSPDRMMKRGHDVESAQASGSEGQPWSTVPGSRGWRLTGLRGGSSPMIRSAMWNLSARSISCSR